MRTISYVVIGEENIMWNYAPLSHLEREREKFARERERVDGGNGSHVVESNLY